jgi:hypothetical protein
MGVPWEWECQALDICIWHWRGMMSFEKKRKIIEKKFLQIQQCKTHAWPVR